MRATGHKYICALFRRLSSSNAQGQSEESRHRGWVTTGDFPAPAWAILGCKSKWNYMDANISNTHVSPSASTYSSDKDFSAWCFRTKAEIFGKDALKCQDKNDCISKCKQGYIKALNFQSEANNQRLFMYSDRKIHHKYISWEKCVLADSSSLISRTDMSIKTGHMAE